MTPLLNAGDWAVVVRDTVRRGAVVVVDHPERPGLPMVKRLVGVPGDLIGDRRLEADEWWVEGDNAAASTDSRTLGPVTRAAMAGRVLAVYWPPERARWVAGTVGVPSNKPPRLPSEP